MIKNNYKEPLLSFREIKKRYSEIELLNRYLSIKKIPCLINAPYRTDKKPSLGLYVRYDKVYFKDFATNQSGNIIELFKILFNCDFQGVLEILNRDLMTLSTSQIKSLKMPKIGQIRQKSDTDIQIKIRDWKDYDFEYWASYGVTKETLKKSKVLPISYYSINQTLIKADKFAYAYVLKQEGKYRYKIYQPFSFYKWTNNYLPNTINLLDCFSSGDKLVICSSLKDAMCLYSQTDIPCICPQGEGYKLDKNLVLYLKSKFKQVYILLDNDKVGIKYGKQMAEDTGFTNIVLPQFEGGKDVSDYFTKKGKEVFRKTLLNLLNKTENDKK